MARLHFTSKQLTKTQDIIKAQALLYRVYMLEQDWILSADNPSNLHVKKSQGLAYLTDDYARKARWFGVYDADSLIACGRLAYRDDHRLLEMERYNIPQTLRVKLRADHSPHLVELNRSALEKEYRGTKAWVCLLQAGFNYCKQHDLAAVSSTSFTKVQRFHDAIGFTEVAGAGFKYDTNEKDDSVVYYATQEQVVKIAATLDKIIEDYTRTN